MVWIRIPPPAPMPNVGAWKRDGAANLSGCFYLELFSYSPCLRRIPVSCVKHMFLLMRIAAIRMSTAGKGLPMLRREVEIF